MKPSDGSLGHCDLPTIDVQLSNEMEDHSLVVCDLDAPVDGSDLVRPRCSRGGARTPDTRRSCRRSLRRWTLAH
jgi:hypothetical protein